MTNRRALVRWTSATEVCLTFGSTFRESSKRYTREQFNRLYYVV